MTLQSKKVKLPELEKLKEVLNEDPNAIHFYKRTEFEGSDESVKYLKKEIKKLDNKK